MSRVRAKFSSHITAATCGIPSGWDEHLTLDASHKRHLSMSDLIRLSGGRVDPPPRSESPFERNLSNWFAMMPPSKDVPSQSLFVTPLVSVCCAATMLAHIDLEATNMSPYQLVKKYKVACAFSRSTLRSLRRELTRNLSREERSIDATRAALVTTITDMEQCYVDSLMEREDLKASEAVRRSIGTFDSCPKEIATAYFGAVSQNSNRIARHAFAAMSTSLVHEKLMAACFKRGGWSTGDGPVTESAFQALLKNHADAILDAVQHEDDWVTALSDTTDGAKLMSGFILNRIPDPGEVSMMTPPVWNGLSELRRDIRRFIFQNDEDWTPEDSCSTVVFASDVITTLIRDWVSFFEAAASRDRMQVCEHILDVLDHTVPPAEHFHTDIEQVAQVTRGIFVGFLVLPYTFDSTGHVPSFDAILGRLTLWLKKQAHEVLSERENKQHTVRRRRRRKRGKRKKNRVPDSPPSTASISERASDDCSSIQSTSTRQRAAAPVATASDAFIQTIETELIREEEKQAMEERKKMEQYRCQEKGRKLIRRVTGSLQNLDVEGAERAIREETSGDVRELDLHTVEHMIKEARDAIDGCEATLAEISDKYRFVRQVSGSRSSLVEMVLNQVRSSLPDEIEPGDATAWVDGSMVAGLVDQITRDLEETIHMSMELAKETACRSSKWSFEFLDPVRKKVSVELRKRYARPIQKEADRLVTTCVTANQILQNMRNNKRDILFQSILDSGFTCPLAPKRTRSQETDSDTPRLFRWMDASQSK